MYQLATLGLDAARLTHVFLTHHHGDHCFGLPTIVHARALAFAQRGCAALLPMSVFCPRGGDGTCARNGLVSDAVQPAYVLEKSC